MSLEDSRSGSKPPKTGVQKKQFVRFDDVLRIAEEEDRKDYAKRSLRFKFVFLLVALPYFLLQARIVSRFETKQMLASIIEGREFFVGSPTHRNESVSMFGSEEKEKVEVPFFWMPSLETFREVRTGGSEVGQRIKFDKIISESMFWDWMVQVVGQTLLFPQFCSTRSASEKPYNETFVLPPKIQDNLTFPVNRYDRYWAFDDPDLLYRLSLNYDSYCSRQSYVPNFLLYGVRIRQVQVLPRQDCVTLTYGTLGCYGPFTEEDEAQSTVRYGPFSSENTSHFPYEDTFVFSWEQAEVLEEEPIQTQVDTYPGSGFSVVLPLLNSSWFAVVNKLFQYRTGIRSWSNNQVVPAGSEVTNRFVQPGARALIVVLSLYNPNVNLYTYVECVISISASGAWIPSVNYYVAPAPTQVLVTPTEWAEMVFAALTFLYILVTYLRFLRNATIFRYKSLWGVLSLCLELVIMILFGFILQWIFTNYFFISGYAPDFPDLDSFRASVNDVLWVCPESDEMQAESPLFRPCGGAPPFYAGIGSYVKKYQQMQMIFAWVFLLMMAKIFQEVLVFDKFRLFYEANHAARYNFLYFAIIYLVMFVGYSLAGYLYFSDSLETFSKITASALTVLLSYVRVDVDYANLVFNDQYSRVYGRFYLVSFFFIFNWVFACVLLAIIYNAWQTVKEKSYSKEKRRWARIVEAERLSMMYARDTTVEKVYVDHTSVEDGVGELVSDLFHGPVQRKRSRVLLCERLCCMTRPGWYSKEMVLINLKEWRETHNSSKFHFVDLRLLREALRGREKSPTPVDQAMYYIDLLGDKRYSKLQVDQELSRMELQRRALESATGVTSSKRNISGPTVSTAKSISNSVSDMAKDQDIWLAQLDSHLASLQLRQAQNSRDVSQLCNHINHLSEYVQK